MNILLIGPLPPLRGGISDFNYELLKKLIKTQNAQALSFHYLYPKFLFPGKTQLSKKVPFDFKIKKINPYNPFDYINTLNHIRKIKPEKIISTHWNPIFSISFAILNYFSSDSIDKIGILHNIKSHEPFFLDNFFIKFYIKSLNKAVFLSNFTKKQVNNITKIDSLSLFHPIPQLNQKCIDKKDAISKMKLDPKKKYLLHFGIIRKYKGLNLLLKSLKKVVAKNKAVHLIIAGEFYENVETYKNLIIDLELQNHVTIENTFIPEKDFFKWFSISDFIIQANTSATQSGVTALSIYFEKIMISTASGGIKEILNEKNSYLCQKNTNSISSRILEAFESDNDDKKLEIQKLKKNLQWNKFSKDLIKFIK
ncbi:MAG: hypothetical protein CMD13_02290 [Flavobacteriales bacterium]|nr:hypothetical protein [Flavobacteriales bacterium]|tara:strand:- start:424 stop:1524 length:1101 start_codon:yes stop_codon:yes gene_type:complete